MPLAFRWLGVVTFFFVAAPRGHSEIAPIPGDGYIRSWLVLGPYMASGPAPGKDYLRQSWITDGTLTEETVCPQAGAQVHTDYSKAAPVGLYETRPELGLNPNGKEGPTWFRYDTRPWADDWHVRIDSEVFGQPYNLDNSATLGCVYLVNSGDDAVDVLIGPHSDDSLQVTLNNDELFAYSVAREVGYYGRPQHLARAKIYPGYNRVLFKVTTGVYAVGFALRVTGLDHAPLPSDSGIGVSLLEETDGILQATIRVERGTGPFDAILSASASHCAGREIQSFSWDFGNGAVQNTSDPSQPVTVAYPGPGEYFVRLAMVDASGLVGNAAARVRFDPPRATSENFADDFSLEGDPLASGFWTLDDPAGLVSPGDLVSLENQDGRLVWTVNEWAVADTWCNFDYTPKLLVDVEGRDFSFETEVEILERTEETTSVGIILAFEDFPETVNHFVWSFQVTGFQVTQCSGALTPILDAGTVPSRCQPCDRKHIFRIEKIGPHILVYDRASADDPWRFAAQYESDRPPKKAGLAVRTWWAAGVTATFEYAVLGDPDPSLIPRAIGETPPFRDEFESDPVVRDPWVLDGPSGFVGSGGVTLTSDGSALRWHNAPGANTDNWCAFQQGPMLQVPVGAIEEWAFEARVTVTKGSGSTVQAGIALDWDSFPPIPPSQVFFGPSELDLGLEGGCWAVPKERIRGEITRFAMPRAVSLLVAKRGWECSFYFRYEDGEPWRLFRTLGFPAAPDRVGLFLKNWQKAPEGEARFEYAALSTDLPPARAIRVDPERGFGLAGEEYLRKIALDGLPAGEVAIAVEPADGSSAFVDGDATLRFLPLAAGTYTLTLRDAAGSAAPASLEVEVADEARAVETFDAPAVAGPWRLVEPETPPGDPAPQSGFADGEYRSFVPYGGWCDDWGWQDGSVYTSNAVELLRQDVDPSGDWIIEVTNVLFQGFVNQCSTRGFHSGIVVAFVNTETEDPRFKTSLFVFGPYDAPWRVQSLVVESRGQALFAPSWPWIGYPTDQPDSFRVRKEGNRFSMEVREGVDGPWKAYGTGRVRENYVVDSVGILTKKWYRPSEYESRWDDFAIAPSPCPTRLSASVDGSSVRVEWNGMRPTALTVSLDGGPGNPVPEGERSLVLSDVPPGDHAVRLDSSAQSFEAYPCAALTTSARVGVPVFVGDVNCSDKLDFADAIALLDYLFIGGKKGKKALCCAANADANDDGRVCIGDVVAILQFLFCGRGLVAPDGTAIRGMPPRCQLYAASDVVLPCDEPCEP